MAKAKPKMGRPRKEIDWKAFSKLCAIQATEIEIAGWFDMSIDTLELRVKEQFGQTFTDVYAQKRGNGKISLRRLQFQAAQKGNSTMLVWLGKQWLKQADKHEVTGADGGPITLKIAAELEICGQEFEQYAAIRRMGEGILPSNGNGKSLSESGN